MCKCQTLDKCADAVLIKANGILARVLQHEIDRLQRILILDYLPWCKRLEIARNLFDN